MERIILVTGGARSGKSDFALNRAMEIPGERRFVATAQPFDDEMKARIDRHRADREGFGFKTLEAPLDLAGAFAPFSDATGITLVDCLTVWLGNRFHAHGQDDAAIEASVSEVVDAVLAFKGGLILVTNEVGLSIVPENPMARRFRDCAGFMNRALASVADAVYLCVCGIPLKIK